LRELLPGEADDAPTCGRELGIPEKVRLVLELAEPVASAIELDDDLQPGVREVDAGDPLLGVAGVLLAHRFGHPEVTAQLDELALELAGGGYVALATVEQESSHEAGSLPPSLAELSDDVAELTRRHPSVCQAVV